MGKQCKIMTTVQLKIHIIFFYMLKLDDYNFYRLLKNECGKNKKKMHINMETRKDEEKTMQRGKHLNFTFEVTKWRYLGASYAKSYDPRQLG